MEYQLKKMKITLTLALFFAAINFGSAQTYYKYQPRSASSQVNYAEIGQNISGSLMKAAEAREERLRAAGWSSEWEYRNHVQSLKYEAKRRKREQKINEKQMKLKSKFYKGNKKIKTRTDGSGKVIYYQD
jgi:hypothetical protein